MRQVSQLRFAADRVKPRKTRSPRHPGRMAEDPFVHTASAKRGATRIAASVFMTFLRMKRSSRPLFVRMLLADNNSRDASRYRALLHNRCRSFKNVIRLCCGSRLQTRVSDKMKKLFKMTMNCCVTGSETDNDKSSEMLANEISAKRCRNCLGHSRPVSRKTVLLMLKPELLEQAMTGTLSFCSTPDCPVVYFENRRPHSFTIDHLRVTLGGKATNDPIALCYCFGFDESHIRDEISRTGSTMFLRGSQG